MKKIALALVALMLCVGFADAAKTKTVVKQRRNKTVVKTVTRGRQANAAQVNVNVNSGHAHVNTFVAHSHAGFAVGVNHYHNGFAVANQGYGYNFSIVQPVTFAVASPLTVATVPVDIVNAPAYTQTQTCPAQATLASTGATYGYTVAAPQKVIKTQVIKTINVGY